MDCLHGGADYPLAYFSVFLPPCRTIIISATVPSVLVSRK